jgi:hypothetical protein
MAGKLKCGYGVAVIAARLQQQAAIVHSSAVDEAGSLFRHGNLPTDRTEPCGAGTP